MINLGIFDFNKKRQLSDKQPLFNGKWPDYVVTLDENNITEFITKYPLSLVDFWASWCAPCREVAPRLRRLSKLYKGKIAFGKLDIQNNQDIAKEYNITGIPHLMVFKNGKKISSITGVKSIGDLKDTIDALLKNIKQDLNLKFKSLERIFLGKMTNVTKKQRKILIRVDSSFYWRERRKGRFTFFIVSP